jgi:glycosyltransferase involved in cell wall biosynthesis
MSMRIGSYVIGGYPKPGGVSTAVRGLTQALARDGHELLILSQGVHDDTLDEGPVTLRTFARPQQSIPFLLSPSLLTYLRTNPDRLDLIVLNGMFNPDLIRLARVARKAALPYVVASHGPYHPMLMRRHTVRKQVYLRVLERHLLNHATAVQLLADQHRVYLERMGVESPTITIPNGLSISAQHLPLIMTREASETNEVVIGYLGRIDAWHKGLDLLIEGFAAALKQVPGIKLEIQGPDWGDKANLQERVTQLGLHDSISFRAPLVGPPIEGIATWDVLIAPSRWDGAPLTVLEAMYAGRPVICSSEAGMAEHVRAAGSGLVVKPTATGIADGIVTFVGNRARWQTMAESGRAYALAHFNWETIAKNAATQYAALLH